MDIAAGLSRIKRIQAALRVLVLLQLTANNWPRQAIVSDGAHYDFIIVGGGSAGCVLANRLSEVAHFQVLLIEAGGDPPFESTVPGLASYLLRSDYDWNYTAAYDINREYYQNGIPLPLSQGKVLGGSSTINAMVYIRGSPHDFQVWAEVSGDQTWNYENVLPYFKKSEYIQDDHILKSNNKEFHGTSGYLHVTTERHPEIKKYEDMFRELGYKILLDLNGNETFGYGEPSYTVNANGVRESTAYSFITPVKNRENLHVLRNTLVTKVLFDKFKDAKGVQVLTEDNKTICLMAQREVIISAGGINSAKLLLLSGIGPEYHLKTLGIQTTSDLPVGENLQDHLATMGLYKLNKTNKFPEPPNPYQFRMNLNGFIVLNKTQTYPDCQSVVHFVPNNSQRNLQNCLTFYPADYDTCQKFHDAEKDRETIFVGMNLLPVKSRGVIKLKSADPLDKPLVFLNSFSNESDLDTLAKCFEKFDEIRNSTYFKSVDGEFVDPKLPKCEGLAFGSREYWKCYILSMKFTNYHYCGACGMGAVLDSRLRVRGVDRLRVADSCAIPNITSGNTNAPTIMLAEKAADMIKQDNGCKIDLPT